MNSSDDAVFKAVTHLFENMVSKGGNLFGAVVKTCEKWKFY